MIVYKVEYAAQGACASLCLGLDKTKNTEIVDGVKFGDSLSEFSGKCQSPYAYSASKVGEAAKAGQEYARKAYGASKEYADQAYDDSAEAVASYVADGQKKAVYKEAMEKQKELEKLTAQAASKGKDTNNDALAAGKVKIAAA